MLYTKMKRYLQKIKKNFRPNFRKFTFLLTTSALLTVEWYFAYQMKRIDVLYNKMKYNKKISNILDRGFEKKFNFTSPLSLLTVTCVVGENA